MLTRTPTIDSGASDARSLQFAGARPIAASGRPGCAPDDLVALYERALSVPDADRWPFDLARIRLSYGERLRTAGRADAARFQLRLGRARSGSCGRRRGSGGRPTSCPRLATSSVGYRPGGTLTATERQVAELAAAGLANRAIAARLRLPDSTVRNQLSWVYAKLGVPARGALRDALALAGGQ